MSDITDALIKSFIRVSCDILIFVLTECILEDLNERYKIEDS